MEYALEWAHIYKDVNLWAYLHFNAGHEATGQHAQTIDEDLVWFLQQILNDRSIVLLEGDHGMRYGDW